MTTNPKSFQFGGLVRVDRLNSTSSKICGIGFGIPLLRKVFMGKEESKEMLLLFLRVEFMVRFFFFFFQSTNNNRWYPKIWSPGNYVRRA